MESFSTYNEMNKAKYDLEWSIIREKIAQGANGVEWIIINGKPKESRMRGLDNWLEQLQIEANLDLDSVMIDALTMDSEEFYARHEFNWWLSVSYTLTYLYLLKQRNYEQYFELIKKLDEKVGRS